MGRKKKNKNNMVRKEEPSKKKNNNMEQRKKKPRVVSGTVEEFTAWQNRHADKYREIMKGFNGFDLCGRKAPLSSVGLKGYYCDDGLNRCCDLVQLYAKFGLHRYNLLKGKDLQLSRVKRYNVSHGVYVRTIPSYYISLEANDPSTDPPTLHAFEVKLDVRTCHILCLRCTISRHRGETTETFKDTGSMLYDPRSFMPELPPENLFKDDDTTNQRFYVLKESELQHNYHWLRLYLELTVAKPNRLFGSLHTLTKLKILNVAMESSLYLTQGILARDAAFYIRYEDSCEARVGKDVDRLAIVRRLLDDQSSEILSIVGRQYSCSQTIIPSNGETGSSSAQG